MCEIIDQAGAGFYKPGQQQRLLFPVEAGQEICSPEGLVRLVSLAASFQSKGGVIFDFLSDTKMNILFDNL